MKRILGACPLSRIAQADTQQQAGIAVVQLPAGRIVSPTAPFGQYLLLRVHSVYVR